MYRLIDAARMHVPRLPPVETATHEIVQLRRRHGILGTGAQLVQRLIAIPHRALDVLRTSPGAAQHRRIVPAASPRSREHAPTECMVAELLPGAGAAGVGRMVALDRDDRQPLMRLPPAPCVALPTAAGHGCPRTRPAAVRQDDPARLRRVAS